MFTFALTIRVRQRFYSLLYNGHYVLNIKGDVAKELAGLVVAEKLERHKNATKTCLIVGIPKLKPASKWPMKTTSVEVISTHDSVNVYKCNRSWKRPLMLTVHDKRSKREASFPENVDTLRLNNALSHGGCVLSVRTTGLKRFMQQPTYHKVAPSTRNRVAISGSGRCGTQAIARYLDGLIHENGQAVTSRHETLHEYILPLLVDGQTDAVAEILQGMQHYIESAPYYALYPTTLRADLVLHIVRDGRRVVQSGMNRGWYGKDSLWNRIKPSIGQDRFANCCHLWRVTTENMSCLAQHSFRLEDLKMSQQERTRLAHVVGVSPTSEPLPHVNQGMTCSDYSQWSDRERQTFSEICGPMMDRFYPGWDK